MPSKTRGAIPMQGCVISYLHIKRSLSNLVDWLIKLKVSIQITGQTSKLNMKNIFNLLDYLPIFTSKRTLIE